MGIAEVRDAFTHGGDGQLVCEHARLYYDHSDIPNMQVLEFDGHYTGGEAFKIVSDPFAGDIDPNMMARQVARDMVNALMQGRARARGMVNALMQGRAPTPAPDEGYG
jgi:hypothetical protein